MPGVDGPLARDAARRGVFILALGVFVMSMQDPIVKSLAGEYPVAQAIVIRSLAALPIFAVLLHRAGGWRIVTEGRPGILLVRGGILMISYTAYFLAFPAMPLANVVALYFTAPLWVVALSPLLLHERQGWQRWVAVLIGFAGAVVAAQPAGGGIGLAALLPLAAAAFYALAMIVARREGDAGSATVMAFHQNSVYLLGALAFTMIAAPFAVAPDVDGISGFLLRPWVMPDATGLVLLLLTGPIAVGGTTLLTKAYREAPPGAVTVIEYTLLIWATLWGLVFFGEIPDAWTLVGAGLIIASGAFAMTRAIAPPATRR